MKHFWVPFLHFEGLVNEEEIFIYKSFVMNFKISGFAGVAG